MTVLAPHCIFLREQKNAGRYVFRIIAIVFIELVAQVRISCDARPSALFPPFFSRVYSQFFLRTFNICLFEARVIHCVPARDNIERLSTTYLSCNEGFNSIFVIQLSYR